MEQKQCINTIHTYNYIFTSIKKCQVCTSVPVPQVREVKEIECQKCRKYKVPVPKTRWVKECNPVYDEKCKTEYHQHCKEETRCHQLYQTICDNSGYQQVRMLGGFKLKNAYSRAALNFANLKCQAYYQIVLSNINTSQHVSKIEVDLEKTGVKYR